MEPQVENPNFAAGNHLEKRTITLKTEKLQPVLRPILRLHWGKIKKAKKLREPLSEGSHNLMNINAAFYFLVG